MKRCLAFLFAFALSPVQSMAGSERITVFAAASLAGVLQDIADSYPSQIAFSFGGSGVMARQVAAGAPADVVVLANSDWMNWLEDQRSITTHDTANLASNTLVLIGPAGDVSLEPNAIQKHLSTGRLAMGQRNAVPAGGYAQTWLQSAGLWEQLMPHLAETDNVRAALALVARGETPLGIVYATDALAEPRVSVVYAVPPESHAPILYPAASLTPAGTAFLDHLTGNKAAETFAMHGFGPSAP